MKDKRVFLLTLGVLIFGFALGAYYSEVRYGPFEQKVHDDAQKHSENHTHAEYVVAENEPRPSLRTVITPDEKSGYNVQLMTQNFTFSPERASLEHVPGEGHAHIYVDGVKIGRVYGEWYHIEGLSIGDHVIRVSLNTNDHREYIVDGVHVASEEKITVESSESEQSDKSSSH